MAENKYMNSYLAGVLLGLTLLITLYITGRGLGASGAFKSAAVAAVHTIAPDHAAEASFYREYTTDHPDHPLKNWLVFEVIGVIMGAFISGLISNRLILTMEHPPKTKIKVRAAGAIIGGALFGFGAQLGRGCTSGAALTGMAVMSTGGIITMLAIFGGAYAFAYFFRKLWI
ncbi:YeeE/YedE family protein [candidate division KSB1 bacterium]|nr:YeeE/YedE family protein [candidate division KSB1 bacterium]